MKTSHIFCALAFLCAPSLVGGCAPRAPQQLTPPPWARQDLDDPAYGNPGNQSKAERPEGNDPSRPWAWNESSEPDPRVPLAADLPVPPVDCDNEGPMGSVALSAEDAAARHGQGVRMISDVISSKARPIEVCGPAGQRTYLFEAHCDNGARLVPSPEEARNARVGSVGPGGRCGKVVDLYEVKCPEERYEVYMDMYFCGPGESFMGE